MKNCPICEREVDLCHQDREITVRDRTVTVEHEFFWCAGCEEPRFTPQQMDEVLRRAADIVRREDGVIPAQEIRELRERLGYNQVEFETILGSGPKTVTRWERGTVAPSGAASTLLALFQKHPGLAHEIAQEKGIRPRVEATPSVHHFAPHRVIGRVARVAQPLSLIRLGNVFALVEDFEADSRAEQGPQLPFKGPSWSFPQSTEAVR